MTKIRCQICGGENLHSESAIKIVCDDCGNQSYIIPEEAIVSIDNPLDGDIVAIRYNRNNVDCPRKSICLNDTMCPGSEPCKTCKVVRNIYNNINEQLVDLYEHRVEYLRNHPELNDCEN